MIEKLNNTDKIKFNILGKSFELEVLTQRAFLDFNVGDAIPLNNKELDELNWLINSKILDTLEKELLDYCNQNYKKMGESEIPEIYPEINFKQLYILTDNRIAVLGECNSDFEHGISVKFNNREFCGIGQNADWI